MIYTFVKQASKDDASLDRYWIDPSGIEYYVNGFKGTHMMWIFDNLEVLQQKERDEIAKLQLTPATIERFAGVLYELGWVRISENVALMEGEKEMPRFANFLVKHKNDPNMVLDGNKKITIIHMSPETHESMTVAQIVKKYGSKTMNIKAAFDKISSRDAVKDTIEYWDKAKNKDFSKYWRKLKKKKKANYIPNPDTKVPQPLKRNYDYGEIPNYVDRIKWHLRKERRKKRKASLDTI